MIASLLFSGAAPASIGEMTLHVEKPLSLLSKIPDVMVVRAGTYCFADTIVATGFLVPREEAVVFPLSGYRVAEVLAEEGATIANSQYLARLIRLEGSNGPIQPGQASLMLRAPAAGVITRISMHSATAPALAGTDSAREPLFRIMIDGIIDGEVEVPSIHIPKLRADIDQVARIQVGNGMEISGRVRLMPGEIDRKTQIGRVRLAIEQNSSLRTGMFVQAVIETSHRCGVSVPRSAVTYKSGSANVEAIVNGVVKKRSVVLGVTSDTNMEIMSGVSADDDLVINAGTFLRDGDRVKGGASTSWRDQPVQVRPR
jgi:multidrug efflux pump subunit AcrA (membrane-fusion protein)